MGALILGVLLGRHLIVKELSNAMHSFNDLLQDYRRMQIAVVQEFHIVAFGRDSRLELAEIEKAPG